MAELLDRLGDSHFVAVTGTSGSGKSSLVRAGLRPALHRGYLRGRQLAVAVRDDAAGRRAAREHGRGAGVRASTSRRTICCDRCARPAPGLSQAVARAGLGAGESLLIIADQFEELFRFDVTRAQQADAALFVSQLLEATEQREAAIYVVVTMRSEFLGRSSEFTGLAEAFNRSQYLVPRLTRDERREAIERPLRAGGHDALARARAAGAQRRRRRSRPAAGAAARAAADLPGVGALRRHGPARAARTTSASAASSARSTSTATRSWPS